MDHSIVAEQESFPFFVHEVSTWALGQLLPASLSSGTFLAAIYRGTGHRSDLVWYIHGDWEGNGSLASIFNSASLSMFIDLEFGQAITTWTTPQSEPFSIGRTKDRANSLQGGYGQLSNSEFRGL